MSCYELLIRRPRGPQNLMLLLHMLFLSQHIIPYDFLVKGSVNLGGKTLRIQALKCFPCQFVFMVLECTMNALSWVEKKS